MDGFEDFIIEDETGFSFQPATSPVWDTAWNLIALRESGLAADHPALVKAAGWLVGKEIRKAGDWRVKNPDTQPGGWSFEFANDWYPDLDDSAVVPRALLGVQLPEQEEQAKTLAIQRALKWVLSMQSKDGGWGAFDRDNDKQVLTQVPFADFMSPLDPTCADVTAHVMEMLVGLNQGQAALRRAVEFLKATQEADGAWYGRWGVNYVYGTGLSLAGLAAAGEDLQQPYIQRAIAWLVAHQNPDGGWGETCQTYEDPELARDRSQHGFTDSLGVDRTDQSWRGHPVRRCRLASTICCAPRQRMAPGRKSITLAPGSPKYSTCVMISTGSVFR